MHMSLKFRAHNEVLYRRRGMRDQYDTGRTDLFSSREKSLMEVFNKMHQWACSVRFKPRVHNFLLFRILRRKGNESVVLRMGYECQPVKTLRSAFHWVHLHTLFSCLYKWLGAKGTRHKHIAFSLVHVSLPCRSMFSTARFIYLHGGGHL